MTKICNVCDIYSSLQPVRYILAGIVQDVVSGYRVPYALCEPLKTITQFPYQDLSQQSKTKLLKHKDLYEVTNYLNWCYARQHDRCYIYISVS